MKKKQTNKAWGVFAIELGDGHAGAEEMVECFSAADGETFQDARKSASSIRAEGEYVVKVRKGTVIETEDGPLFQEDRRKVLWMLGEGL